jgi:hypothetical protein
MTKSILLFGIGNDVDDAVQTETGLSADAVSLRDSIVPDMKSTSFVKMSRIPSGDGLSRAAGFLGRLSQVGFEDENGSESRRAVRKSAIRKNAAKSDI